jgi:hypothetical protein
MQPPGPNLGPTPQHREEPAMKIIDRREIEFDANSVVRAIAVSAQATKNFAPPGLTAFGVRFHQREGNIDILYGTTQAPRIVSITAESLGALLVSYCIRLHIPTPKKSDKGIRVENDAIFLAFRTKYDDAPAPTDAQIMSQGDRSELPWTWLQLEHDAISDA